MSVWDVSDHIMYEEQKAAFESKVSIPIQNKLTEP